jgi:hypothetical protein
MSNGLEKGSNEKNDLLITKTRQKRVRRTLVHTRQVDGLRKTKGVAIWYCAALPRTRHMREDPPPLLPPPLALSPFVLSLTESRISLLYRFEGPILSLSLSLYIYIRGNPPHPSPLHTTPPFRIDRLRHRRGSQAMANIDMAAILADLDRADARLPKTKIVCTLGPASRSVPHDRKAAPRRHERRPRVPILSVVVPVLTTDSFVLLLRSRLTPPRQCARRAHCTPRASAVPGVGVPGARGGVGPQRRQWRALRPRRRGLVIDSGSDVIWVQCRPCEQSDPLFDLVTSSSFSGLARIGVGDERLPLQAGLFQLTEDGVVMDTGTAVKRLPPEAYHAPRDAFAGAVGELPRSLAVSLFDTCYDLSAYTSVRVPTTVSLYLEEGATLTLPARNLLVEVIDGGGIYCLVFVAPSSGTFSREGSRSPMASLGSDPTRADKLVPPATYGSCSQLLRTIRNSLH